jgi:hypothetical protein
MLLDGRRRTGWSRDEWLALSACQTREMLLPQPIEREGHPSLPFLDRQDAGATDQRRLSGRLPWMRERTRTGLAEQAHRSGSSSRTPSHPVARYLRRRSGLIAIGRPRLPYASRSVHPQRRGILRRSGNQPTVAVPAEFPVDAPVHGAWRCSPRFGRFIRRELEQQLSLRRRCRAP